MLATRGAIGQYAIGELPIPPPSGAYSLTADLGTYTLTGQAAGLAVGYKITAATGSYTLTGQDATLDRDRRIAGDVGTYTITGQDVGTVAARVLYADPFTRLGGTVYAFPGFAALGQTAIGQSTSEVISTPANTYSLIGYDTQLRKGLSLTAGEGAYTVTGYDAGSYFTRAIIAEVGVYTLSGQAAPSIIVMPAGAGSYTLTGQDVTFNRVRKRIRGFARVGSAINARAA